MDNEGQFRKILQLNYCIICRRFYVNSCRCLETITVQGILSPFFLQCKDSNIFSNFICLAIIIYNLTNKFLRLKRELEWKKQINPKKITLKGFRDIESKHNLFSKYIYLCNNNGHKINLENCSFYVYMMSAHIEAENEASQLLNANEASPSNSNDESGESTPRNEYFTITSTSNTSLGSKKSATSSVLSRISKSLKRRPKHEKKSPESERDSNLQKYESKSKIPIARSRMKASTSHHKSEISISQKHQSFFRKFMAKSANSKAGVENKTTKSNLDLVDNGSEVEKKCHSFANVANVEKKLSEIKLASKISDFCIRSSSSKEFISCGPTFVGSTHINLDLNTSDGLREVIELTQRLHDSEVHLTHMISKYIQDRTFERELLSTLTNHAKLHLEAERRAQHLAHEMWLQHTEVMKSHETTLKENLNALIKQNRQLQEETENLLKKNEQIWSIKLRQFPEFMRQPNSDSSTMLIENLSKNNNKLRDKLNSLLGQLEEQDRDLQIFQRKNQLLEQQLRTSNSQVHTFKAMLQRIQTENELEQSNLAHQLQASQMTIKESAEAGDVLLEDLDALKRQAKGMPCAINWTKFKSRGSSIPDLIYMCRSCINELAKELTNKQTEIILKEKDNISLRDEIKRLDGNLESSKIEHQNLSNRLRTFEEQEVELKRYMGKCGALEHELGEYRKDIERVVGEFEKEKVSLIASVEDMDKLNKKIIEKEEELILNKEQMCEYKSENDALRMQLHGLKQVLTASGSGDVARELADTQEKMTFFQSQYYQLLSEKNYLIEQLQTANVERGTLNQFQNNYYQFIQVQQRDLEELNKDNMALREQLDLEKNQVAALTMERAKLKDEKNVMREIYYQLKNEINKVGKLQGEVTGMNIEANRLAIIAEFNKQLGEKLQCEVAERDEKISELQSSMEKLNNAQLENTRDKVALCVELTEICSLNNQLNSTLVAEHQKSAHLDESKKQLESTASLQLRAIEEMQREERAALKELLKDFKNVVTQRDNLLVAQNEYLQQISDLRTNAVMQTRNIEELSEKYVNALQGIESYENKYKQSEDEIERLEGIIRDAQDITNRLEEGMRQLQVQKGDLESTKSYLQNTVQKLHSDLDEARKTDLDMKQQLKKGLKKAESLQCNLDKSNAELKQSTNDNQVLVQEITRLNEEYERLYENHKSNVTMEDILKEDLERAQDKLDGKNNEIERLEKVIFEKDSELLELKECSEDLKKLLKDMEADVEDKATQLKLFSEAEDQLAQLQNNLIILQEDHKDCNLTIHLLKEERRKLQGSLKHQLDELKGNCSQQQQCMQELINDSNNHSKEMRSDLQTLEFRLGDMKVAYECEKAAHQELMAAHKDMAYKLLNSVRLLVEEKLKREEAEKNAAALTQKIDSIAEEKSSADRSLKDASENLEDLIGKIDQLKDDNRNIQDAFIDLQGLYKKSLLNCRVYRQQLEHLKKKSKNNSASVKSSKALVLKESKGKMTYEEKLRKLKQELEICHTLILDLKKKISNLKQQLTVSEFQKCEISLRLHEAEAKLKTELNMKEQLNEVNQSIVGEILTMGQEGTITDYVSETLLNLIQGQTCSIVELSK